MFVATGDPSRYQVACARSVELISTGFKVYLVRTLPFEQIVSFPSMVTEGSETIIVRVAGITPPFGYLSEQAAFERTSSVTVVTVVIAGILKLAAEPTPPLLDVQL